MQENYRSARIQRQSYKLINSPAYSNQLGKGIRQVPSSSLPSLFLLESRWGKVLAKTRRKARQGVRLPITGWWGPKILLTTRSIADRARFRIELGQRELQASALISGPPGRGSSVIQLYCIAQLGSRDPSCPTGRQRLHAREGGRPVDYIHAFASFDKSNKCSFKARSFLSWKKERKRLIALKTTLKS